MVPEVTPLSHETVIDQAGLADHWHRAARRTARKVNLGWWFQAFAPLLVIVGVVAFTTIFWFRARHTPLDALSTAAILCGGGALAAVAAWQQSRRKFIPASSALVALEARLHLHNALSTADAGRAAWPSATALPDDGFRWSWPWLGAPALSTIALLVAAFLLPVPRDLEATPPPMTPPLAWPEMQTWLEKLESEKVLPPDQLEELKQKIEELRVQPERDWYGHQSLEATDSLRQSLDRSIDQLGTHLDTAERSLNALQNYSDQLNAESKDKLAADFQAALDGLRANELKLDPELMKKLAAIDPKSLASLSKAQLEQLREAMKKKAGACKNCSGGAGDGKKAGFLGDGEGQDDEEMAELMKLIQGQQSIGSGGVNRGPGAAPLFLGDTESRLGTNHQEAVTNSDLSRATPADLVGLGDKEHELDKSPVAPREAGTAETGQGGERVWKDALSPDERAVLKRYFK